MEACIESCQDGWRELLAHAWSMHGRGIEEALRLDLDANADKCVFPPHDAVFRSFSFFPLSALKVVIVGQDPYINPGEADGLCFSVPRAIRKVPPSLRNVFKELASTHPHADRCNDTDLSDWAAQGVLLLNTALTVRAGASGSHAHIWRSFTRDVIENLGRSCERVVFILWGAHARTFEPCIDATKNCVLKHSHPSPLARKPFVGNRHFQACDEYLAEVQQGPIDWSSKASTR
jgi:uracil-DNA glycosylase